MSGEKTEQPTPKKLRDARKKGQVSRSTDFTQAFLFLTAVGVIMIGGAAYVSELRKLLIDFFRPETLRGQLTTDAMLHRIGYAWGRALLLTAPLLGALFLASAAIGALQVQFLFAPAAVKPKLEKLNPLAGFKNIFFKARTYLELVKNLVKLSVIVFLVYFIVKGSLRDIINSARLDPKGMGALAATLMFSLLLKTGIVFLLIGAADYLLQRRLYIKSLMMTKYEVKREFKEEEGDPHIKHMRRHLHQQLMARSLADNVRRANVVVVNPTHLAVAVEYDDAVMNAPAVTAKGQEAMAQRIIRIAKKSHVPVMRSVPLAHSLYAIEVGEEIPEELYEAVAEVLNWVYQLARAEAM